MSLSHNGKHHIQCMRIAHKNWIDISMISYHELLRTKNVYGYTEYIYSNWMNVIKLKKLMSFSIQYNHFESSDRKMLLFSKVFILGIWMIEKQLISIKFCFKWYVSALNSMKSIFIHNSLLLKRNGLGGTLIW